MSKDLLLEKIDIVEFISQYVDLKRSGEGYKGFSPFKEEKTPSFSVSPKKNIFKDFSTGKGGDVINFYALIKDISYKEAYYELCEQYGIKISKKTSSNLIEYEILNKVLNIYIEELNNNEFAINYLLNRGYDKEDIKNFSLGYANDNWDFVYKKLKDEYSDSELLSLGVVKETENGDIIDFFHNRIIIPIYDKFDNVIAFGGRSVFEKDENVKYLNLGDTVLFKKSNELFSSKGYYKRIKDNNMVVLMEGYFDVLTSLKYGIDVSVATLGTSLSEMQAKNISEMTKNVIIAYDNDEAGRNAVEKASFKLIKYDCNIKCLVINKDAKDPDEYLKKYGFDSFYDEMYNSISILDFLFNRYSKGIDISNTSGKIEVVKRFKEFFDLIDNSIRYDEYIQKLSSLLNVNIEALKNNYNKQFKKYGNLKKIGYNVKDIDNIKVLDTLEEDILLYILKNYDEKNDFINIEFENPYHKQILDEYDPCLSFEDQNQNVREFIFYYNKEEDIYSNNSKLKNDLIKEYIFRKMKSYIKKTEEMLEFIGALDIKTKISFRNLEKDFYNCKNIKELNSFYDKLKELQK